MVLGKPRITFTEGYVVNNLGGLVIDLGVSYRTYRSRCHGNVHLSDDSKSHRIIP